MDLGSSKMMLILHAHIRLSTPAKEAAFATKMMRSHVLSLFSMNINPVRLILALYLLFLVSFRIPHLHVMLLLLMIVQNLVLEFNFQNTLSPLQTQFT